MRTLFLVVCSLCLFSSAGQADTLTVPAPFPTVQSAIDAALPGDTVLVDPGTYLESINFLGKAITVASSAGPDVTILDGQDVARVVTFNTGEGSGSVLRGFEITRGRAVDGAGILVDGASPTLSGLIVRGNNADERGGGIAVLNGSAPVLDGLIIESNTMQSLFGFGGAGIFSADSDLELIDCTLQLNECFANPTTMRGGGVAFVRGDIQVSGCTILRNSADHGSGLYLEAATGSIRDSTVTRNVGSLLYDQGGGLYVYLGDDSLVIKRNVISDNSAAIGGGIAAYSTKVRIINNEITSNAATIGGGVAFVEPLGSDFKKNVVAHNTTSAGGLDLNGGGVHVEEGAVNFGNNTIFGNVSGKNGGGVALTDSATATFSNDVIYDNRAEIAGGAIFFSPGTASVIVNSIVWANHSSTGRSISGDTSQVVITYSNIMGGWGGAGIIAADPKFVNPALGNFHLRLDSPCIDRGTAAAIAPVVDIEGDIRPLDGDVDGIALYDMGSDEVAPEHSALFGTVNAATGEIVDVLFLNGGVGDFARRTASHAGGPFTFTMEAPAGGGNGKYVVHVNSGAPDPGTLRALPGNVGTTAFPFLLPGGATPIAIFNGGLGKTNLVGASTYFDGSPLPDPPPAPAAFLDLPFGDVANLPPGTEITVQGAIIDPQSAGTKPGSVTNGIVVTFF